MAETFFERPILNSPCEVPKLHHPLDEDGQPLEQPPVEGRRRSELITPVPKPRKSKGKKKGKQDHFVFGDEEGLSTPEQEYNPTPIINEIRSHVASWRQSLVEAALRGNREAVLRDRVGVLARAERQAWREPSRVRRDALRPTLRHSHR